MKFACNYQGCSVLPKSQASKWSLLSHVALCHLKRSSLPAMQVQRAPTDMWAHLLSPHICLGAADWKLGWKRRKWAPIPDGSASTNSRAEQQESKTFCLQSAMTDKTQGIKMLREKKKRCFQDMFQTIANICHILQTGWVQGVGKYRFQVHEGEQGTRGSKVWPVFVYLTWRRSALSIRTHGCGPSRPRGKGIYTTVISWFPFFHPYMFQMKPDIPSGDNSPFWALWPYSRSLECWSSALHFLHWDLLTLYLQWLFPHPERGRERMQHRGKRTERGPASPGCRRHNLNFEDCNSTYGLLFVDAVLGLPPYCSITSFATRKSTCRCVL